jgi:hypothetical protein
VCRILRLLDLGSVENGVGSNDNPGAGGGGGRERWKVFLGVSLQ